MKNSIFTLLLLITVLFPGYSQVLIGSGNDTTQDLPFSPYHQYSYSQSIYLASEIGASGNITSIQWYYKGTGALGNSQQLAIYLGTTSKTAFASKTDWEPISNLVLVYSGGISTNSSPGWKTIFFTTPFPYVGINNLVVAVDENQAGGDSIADKFYNGIVTGTRSIANYDDTVNPNPAAPPTATNILNLVPNIILGLNTQGCTAPSSLMINNVGSTSAFLDWIPNQAADEIWEIAVTPLGAPIPAHGKISLLHPFLVTDLISNSCYNVYVRTICNGSNSNVSSWAGPWSFCTRDCTKNASCPGTIQLTAFIDTNNNGVKDAGEQNFNNGTFVYDINNSGTPLYGSSNGYGFSLLESNPANSYNFSFAVNSELTSYYTSSVTYTNITIPSGSNNIYYFPIKQLQTYNDLEIYLGASNPRPGFDYFNYIYYRNKGSETVNSGTIAFTKSPKVSITNISESGATTTPTGFTYTFNNLAPNEERYIYVDMQVPAIPTVNLGDMITSSTTIEPLAGDVTPNNNSSSLSRAVVGSYDPNEMSESHGREIVFNDFTADDYLYYTITFENTGMADAEFIRVEDLLDTALDPNTLVMLNSDHTYNMRRTDNNLVWNFYNINLPPTATSPDESHGFIQFKIKPKTGYTIGTLIPNKANIYFDYNPAIETNTFNTEFVAQLGNPSFAENNIVLYPNPTKNRVQISTQNTTDSLRTIIVSDMLGKTVETITNISANQTTLDVSSLAKGVYMVEITSESNLKLIRKLVIQ